MVRGVLLMCQEADVRGEGDRELEGKSDDDRVGRKG